ISGLATVVVVALLILAFASRQLMPTAAKASATGTAASTATLPPATPKPGVCASGVTAHLPANAYIEDFALSSPDEGWAVGMLTDAYNGPQSSLIVHYSKCAL